MYYLPQLKQKIPFCYGYCPCPTNSRTLIRLQDANAHGLLPWNSHPNGVVTMLRNIQLEIQRKNTKNVTQKIFRLYNRDANDALYITFIIYANFPFQKDELVNINTENHLDSTRPHSTRPHTAHAHTQHTPTQHTPTQHTPTQHTPTQHTPTNT